MTTPFLSFHDVRRLFFDYFRARDHKILPSASLLPHHDQTLLFVNAGMVPFKDVIVGNKAPEFPRVATIQRCVRAGGKHNDLENVGLTPRHHTFFEMLGNFSFGDYFKESAIPLAWNFLTLTLGLDPKKLRVTTHASDQDSFEIWQTIPNLPSHHIIPVNGDDNFWSMGATGPCGPCTEIFYDNGESFSGTLSPETYAPDNRFLEIWNLVFMESVIQEDGSRDTLPRQCVDTGMGLERIASVCQNTSDNYDVDLFQTLIQISQSFTQDTSNRTAHKVISDHLRASALLIAEGVLPSNTSRGYVLRRLLRRASRYCISLNKKDLLLHQMTTIMIEYLGDFYPELVIHKNTITQVIKEEEERFHLTLRTGLHYLEKEIQRTPQKNHIAPEVVFKLYDTYGFPFDITQEILKERKIKADEEAFHRLMSEQKARGKQSWKGNPAEGKDALLLLTEKFGITEFSGYERHCETSTILSVTPKNQDATTENLYWVITDKTTCYPESGGQVGDQGMIYKQNKPHAKIKDTQRYNQTILHSCELLQPLHAGDTVSIAFDQARREHIKRNHSATHLLHHALRHILGSHITQKGSFVSHEKLRFDFPHRTPITPDLQEKIEDYLQDVIDRGEKVQTSSTSMAEAIEQGALALFGEKYEEVVRIIQIPAREQTTSKELCGGTHVQNTAEIITFKIRSVSSIGAGIKRIEAVTGRAAIHYLTAEKKILEDIACQLKTPTKSLRQTIAKMQEKSASSQDRCTQYQKLLLQLPFALLMARQFSNISLYSIFQTLLAQHHVPEELSFAVFPQERPNPAVIAVTTAHNPSTILESYAQIHPQQNTTFPSLLLVVNKPPSEYYRVFLMLPQPITDQISASTLLAHLTEHQKVTQKKPNIAEIGFKNAAPSKEFVNSLVDRFLQYQPIIKQYHLS